MFIASRWIRKDKRVTHVKLRQIKHFQAKRLLTQSKGSFLYSYPLEEQLKRLKSDYKAIFVRHPFERLLSAFGNKVMIFK